MASCPLFSYHRFGVLTGTGAGVLRRPDAARLKGAGAVPAAGVGVETGETSNVFGLDQLVPHCHATVAPLSYHCHTLVVPLPCHFKRIRKVHNGMLGQGLNIFLPLSTMIIYILF